MEKVLKLYYAEGGTSGIPFPSSEDQIEIGAFRYDAKRMGGAPTITATVMYPTCLDGEWTDEVYAEFNGEKYYLKQTPTSSYSNEDERYKHDLELVSERRILDDVYFFDTVVGNPQGEDKPVSDSTKVVFFGGIREFVKRLNSSLEYAKLLKWEDGVDEGGNAIKIPNGYHVVVDDEIETEEKLMSFEDQFFSNVLQEIYNTYEVPYYFDGKTIHIGYSKEGVVLPDLSYGVDNALLSITKNNANQKVVNRATATGSSDNIPFYYPNNSPKGEIAVDTTSVGATFTIVDGEAFSNEVAIGDVVKYGSGFASGMSMSVSDDGNKWKDYSGESLPITIVNMKPTQKWFLYTFNVDSDGRVKIGGNITIDSGDTRNLTEFLTFAEINNRHGKQTVSIEDGYIDCGRLDSGSHTLKMGFSFPYLGRYNYTISASFGTDMASGWYNETQDKETTLAKMGLSYSGVLSSGDTITQTLVKYVKTSQNLMPSIYRNSYGAERFYNAINYPYPKPEGFDDTLLNGYYGEDGILRNPLGEYEIEGLIHNDAYKNEDGTYVHFNHPYVEGRPKEHIFTVEDIKPSIKETINSMGLRIDMFSEFAYDLDDNDELVESEEGSEHEYVHSYFFGKLRKLDFNLFEHAIENQPMTVSFTSGDCGACNFEIGATEEFPQKNPVQVNEDGTLKRDEKGRVICGQFEDITEDECQPEQQDTINNEVWIALKKEDTTYGILMPKATVYEDDGETVKEAGHRPKACTKNEDGTYNNDGDTFVILGINLPKPYTLNAEKKVEAEIIKYIKDNNEEKFTFSIGFSRIYFEEHSTVLEQLSENSKIRIIYDTKPYDLYVSSFSYNMSAGDVLPEIKVELDDTLKVSQNALQNAISEVKSQLGRAIGSIDVVGAATPYFIRKDVDDEVMGNVNFKKGIKFGEGGKVEVLDNNSAKLTIEYLEVTKKASFTSLEIKEKTHVGGQMLITPAAINCGEVEDFDDYYRCYFQTKGTDGDEIFNQFAVGDQAICQTYNAWGSRYYWRLVVGVGEDYIDLSKTDCDEGSDVPMVGDKIIQLGNRTDVTRQAAQVLSAYGDNAPSFTMYNGIDSFSLEGKNITGIIWNPETQEPQMYSYGSFFFGDRELAGNYITFQQKEGDTEKKLHINATVNFSSDSTGLSNLEDWGLLENKVDNIKVSTTNLINQSAGIRVTGNGNNYAYGRRQLTTPVNGGETYTFNCESIIDYAESPSEQYTVLLRHRDNLGTIILEDESNSFITKEKPYVTFKIKEGVTNYNADLLIYCGKAGSSANGDVEMKKFSVVKGTMPLQTWVESPQDTRSSIDTSINGLQEQIDGVVENWNGEGTPTIANEPAVNWSTDADKIAHINDTYINIEQYVDDDTTPTAGHAWRWCKCGEDVTEDYVTVTDKEGNIFKLHWHPIADSDAVKALKEAAEASAAAQEAKEAASAAHELAETMEYLKTAFPGSTLVAGGVVAASTIFVRDTNNVVKGMLNGGAYASDSTHGKLIVAAGSEGSTAAQLANATTRIYEDGAIVSRLMQLLNGCKIGKSIRIEDDSIVVDLPENNGSLRISEDGVYVSGANYATMGNCAGAAVQGFAEGSAIFCPNAGKGIGVHGEAKDGEYAFYSLNGVFAGLRPKTRVITTAGTSSSPNILDAIDFSVFVNLTSGTCYIDLPRTPQDGQEYYIESRGANMAIHIYQAGYSLYSGNTSAVGYTVTQTGRALLRFKYYKDAGIWVYSWLNRAS